MSEHTLSKEQNWGIFSIQKERSLSMSAIPLPNPMDFYICHIHNCLLKLSLPVNEILNFCKKKSNPKMFIYVCAFVNEHKWRIFTIWKELFPSMFAIPHLIPFTSITCQVRSLSISLDWSKIWIFMYTHTQLTVCNPYPSHGHLKAFIVCHPVMIRTRYST